MDTAELKKELFYLTSFLISSARGLADEPAEYGAFRLIDAAGRLLAIMETHGLGDDFLSRLKQAIDQQREGSMGDTEQNEQLDQLIIEIALEMQNRL